MIPLDVQYTVTKKVEQHNFSDYEVRIQSLSHEVELWRRRYLELMAAHDKNVANEEIVYFLLTFLDQIAVKPHPVVDEGERRALQHSQGSNERERQAQARSARLRSSDGITEVSG